MLQNRPHMCGGVPTSSSLDSSIPESSPHVWGCTLGPVGKGAAIAIVPTCVGVYLAIIGKAKALHHRPHMCGGVPQPEIL